MSNLVTAGEFARLANTTKRTVLFWNEIGILKPIRVNSKKYRYYDQRQILDYQKILLLSTLGTSLKEIKHYLKKGTLTELFNNKKELIEKQIKQLEFNLKSLDKFLTNLKQNGTMINPQVKTLKPFGVYFVEKECSYSEINQNCQELVSMFRNKKLTTLSVFYNPSYQPKKSLIRIGILFKKGLKIKPQYKNEIKFMQFNPGRVITYTHNGSGNLLSLFWKELEKYCRLHHIKVNKTVADFEIYRKVNNDPSKQFFEIYLPIS